MLKGGAEFKQTWKYLYDDDGQLESAFIVDNTQWRFSYANHFFVYRRKISYNYCQQKMQIVIIPHCSEDISKFFCTECHI